MALKSFNPDTFLQTWSDEKHTPTVDESHNNNGRTFEQVIREAFGIPQSDSYVYRAQGETTLDMTQRAIGGKRAHGLHGWYHDDNGEPLTPQFPSPEEISAYTTLFTPTLSLPKALTSHASNAKAQTLRSTTSTHLLSNYHISPSSTPSSLPPGLPPPSKKTRTHTNPYLTLWTYSCHELEWAGPTPYTSGTKTSHHILPIFYHHFGCIVPSYSALFTIAKLAQPAKPSVQPIRPILDIGSGNGYWTFMLRNLALNADMKTLDVRPVDSGVSEYRVMWVRDTIKMDGKEYLRRNEGGKGCVLLLVYPQATGDFTAPILKAFEGDTIVVAGTQNKNGFTAFRDKIVDEWVGENLPQFELTLRMPLPSFAGKDEALFVFQRKPQE